MRGERSFHNLNNPQNQTLDDIQVVNAGGGAGRAKPSKYNEMIQKKKRDMNANGGE